MNSKMLFALSAVCLAALAGASCAHAASRRVIVYTSDMPDFSAGIADGLSAALSGDLEFSVVTEPSLLSALLGMPDTACVILATIKAIELQELVEPLLSYFEGGGALIGFQGALGQQNVGDLAREVFPAYGNATGAFTTKEGTPVNEYVRSEALLGFEGLPDGFDLVGQFFVYCADSSRNVVEPEAAGRKVVLYRDKQTGAPLVLAYENAAGSRSVGFSGFFVRDQEDARNYFGKLLDMPPFLDLVKASLIWTMEGSTRYSKYESSYGAAIEEERERLQELRDMARRQESSRQTRRTLILAVVWAIGLLAVGVLVFRAFLRKPAPGA